MQLQQRSILMFNAISKEENKPLLTIAWRRAINIIIVVHCNGAKQRRLMSGNVAGAPGQIVLVVVPWQVVLLVVQAGCTTLRRGSEAQQLV